MGSIPTWIVAGGAIVSAIATGFIAWYAVVNHKLANAIKAKDEQHQQEIKDLYQAIVISNLCWGSYDNDTDKLRNFKELYKGKTKILAENV
jgi:hypothetical protein